jgi:hypothetical protein
MSLVCGPDTHIVLPEAGRRNILEHCRTTLEAYHAGRAEECKAFGLICGTRTGQVITVAESQPLYKNVRSQPPYKERMDRMMAQHAIPSQTPLDRRGWVADPAELFDRIRVSRSKGYAFLGTYHMHWVGWRHDPLRDTPTALDTALARESELLMFIVSMVEPVRPIIRAFYEGKKEEELPVVAGSASLATLPPGCVQGNPTCLSA